MKTKTVIVICALLVLFAMTVALAVGLETFKEEYKELVAEREFKAETIRVVKEVSDEYYGVQVGTIRDWIAAKG